MKQGLEFIKAIPKEALEGLLFIGAVILGTIHKVLRMNEATGIKITFRKILVETFMSFFIAMVVYAVFDQFLHFNRLFTLMMCSVAGSNSAKLYDKLDELIAFLFEWVKSQLEKFSKTNKNEAN